VHFVSSLQDQRMPHQPDEFGASPVVRHIAGMGLAIAWEAFQFQAESALGVIQRRRSLKFEKGLRRGCGERRHSRQRRLPRGCTWVAQRPPIETCTATCAGAALPARVRGNWA
jgi:hypothetical protein